MSAGTLLTRICTPSSLVGRERPLSVKSAPVQERVVGARLDPRTVNQVPGAMGPGWKLAPLTTLVTTDQLGILVRLMRATKPSKVPPVKRGTAAPAVISPAEASVMPAMARFEPPSEAIPAGTSQPLPPKLAIQAGVPVGVNIVRNPLLKVAVPGGVMLIETGKDGSR